MKPKNVPLLLWEGLGEGCNRHPADRVDATFANITRVALLPPAPCLKGRGSK